MTTRCPMKNKTRVSKVLPGVFLLFFVAVGCGNLQSGKAAAPGRSPDPTAETVHLTYTVVDVAPDDILNVRARPDVNAAVVGHIPFYGVDIHIRETTRKAKTSAWMPIRYKDLNGWVNRRYLARQVGAMDEAVSARAGEIMWALKQKDMARLSRLVHPEKGVRFSPYTYVRDEDLVFQADDIKDLMSNPSVYRWGRFDGSGLPITKTFGYYFKRFVYDADFIRPQAVGADTVIGRGNTINNIPEFYPEAIFIEYHFEGMDPKLGGMDWRSLRLVLETHQRNWYLVGIVHDEWTI